LSRGRFAIVERETIKTADRIDRLIEKVEAQKEQLKALIPKSQKEFHDELAGLRMEMGIVQKKRKEATELVNGLKQIVKGKEQKVAELRVDRKAMAKLEKRIRGTEKELTQLENPEDESESGELKR
jgi:hypothetical protein